MRPRVLFVSKPIVPPWHDGSKNLVRDLATSLTRYSPTVLTTPGSDGLGAVHGWPVYVTSGRFSPALEANARVFGALAVARGFDVWNFVFAPNFASSSAARVAMTGARFRGVRSVVQTVASRPKRFEGVSRLLFGHTIVALSEWTRARLLAHGVDGKRLVVIPPCAKPLPVPSAEARAALRRDLELGSGPIVLYPGDVHVSTGAETLGRAVDRIARAIPEVRVVFACRPKSGGATAAETKLRADLAANGLADRTRFVGELADLSPLLHEAAVVALPADDLYGKVDIPLVVIEALAAGVPLVLAHGGPLESVTTARFVEPGDDAGLAHAVTALIHDEARTRSDTEAGRALYAQLFRPEVVAARYEELYDGSGARAR